LFDERAEAVLRGRVESIPQQAFGAVELVRLSVEARTCNLSSDDPVREAQPLAHSEGVCQMTFGLVELP
jgi:hypothetical protein